MSEPAPSRREEQDAVLAEMRDKPGHPDRDSLRVLVIIAERLGDILDVVDQRIPGDLGG